MWSIQVAGWSAPGSAGTWAPMTDVVAVPDHALDGAALLVAVPQSIKLADVLATLTAAGASVRSHGPRRRPRKALYGCRRRQAGGPFDPLYLPRLREVDSTVSRVKAFVPARITPHPGHSPLAGTRERASTARKRPGTTVQKLMRPTPAACSISRPMCPARAPRPASTRFTSCRRTRPRSGRARRRSRRCMAASHLRGLSGRRGDRVARSDRQGIRSGRRRASFAARGSDEMPQHARAPSI